MKGGGIGTDLQEIQTHATESESQPKPVRPPTTDPLDEGGPTTRWSLLRLPTGRFAVAPEIFGRPAQLGVEFGAILALAGRAAPPQGCSVNLEAVRLHREAGVS